MFARFLDTKCYKIQHTTRDVISTSIRRRTTAYDVVSTFKRGHVSTWMQLLLILRLPRNLWSYLTYVSLYHVGKSKLSIYLFEIYLYITRTNKLKYVCIKITTNASSTQSQLVKSTRKSILRVVRLPLFYCYFEEAKRVN